MMSNTVGRLALFATLPLLTSGFTVTQDNDGSGQTVAQAIFTGQGLSVVNWDLNSASAAVASWPLVPCLAPCLEEIVMSITGIRITESRTATVDPIARMPSFSMQVSLLTLGIMESS